jgi:hypothetical protein
VHLIGAVQSHGYLVAVSFGTEESDSALNIVALSQNLTSAPWSRVSKVEAVIGKTLHTLLDPAASEICYQLVKRFQLLMEKR